VTSRPDAALAHCLRYLEKFLVLLAHGCVRRFSIERARRLEIPLRFAIAWNANQRTRCVQMRDFAASDSASGSRLALGQIVFPLAEVSQRHFRFVVAFSVFSIRSLESSFLLPRLAAIKSIVYVRAPTRVTMRVKQRDRCGGAVNTSCCCCCSTREMSRRIMMTKYYDDGAFAIGDSGAERPFRTESRLHERLFLGMNSECPPPPRSSVDHREFC